MIVRPGDVGADVAAVQQLLSERGALPPNATAECSWRTCGPITAGAVKSFQASVGLAVDGIVGPKTLQALNDFNGPSAFVPPPSFADAGLIPGYALKLASADLAAGIQEQPLGSNRGPRVDEYLIGMDGDAKELLQWRRDPRFPGGYQGAPWCGRFAKYMFDDAAFRLGERSPVLGWGNLASALKWHEAALQRGKLADEPRPGRVATIMVPPQGVGAEPHGHVVIIASVHGKRLTTLEGNSGDRVAARWRSVADFSSFIDLG